MKVKIEETNGKVTYLNTLKVEIGDGRIGIYIAGDPMNPFLPVYLRDIGDKYLKTLWVDEEMVYKNE